MFSDLTEAHTVESTGLDARFQKEAVLLANPSVRPSLIKVSTLALVLCVCHIHTKCEHHLSHVDSFEYQIAEEVRTVRERGLVMCVDPICSYFGVSDMACLCCSHQSTCLKTP